MKITKRDLLEWIEKSTPIRYRGNIYRAFYNGRYYFLWREGETIEFYKKSPRIFGLVTNK